MRAKIVLFTKSHFISPGRLLIWILKTFKLVKCTEDKKGMIICNNLTLINFILIYVGPLREPTLTSILIIIQVISLKINLQDKHIL